MNALVAIFLALVLVFGGTALTVYAAQDSLPSEVLYPVKTLSEDALLSLTSSSQARLNLTLDFIDRRLAEISGLQSAGRPIPQKVVDRLQGELDQALTLTAGMDNPAMAQSLDDISQRTHGQLRAMAILVNGNPGGPALVGIQALLKEQAQAVDLGKADPQWFRQKVHQLIPGGNGQQGNRSNKPLGNQNPTKTPETPGDQGHGHGHGPDFPEPTPGPGKGHGHGGQDPMRPWKILPLVIWLVGCSSPAVSSVVSPAGPPTATPAVLSNGPLTLTIYSPQDQATVSDPNMDVKGKVSEDAVLTINDEIYDLKAGEFTQSVQLTEGLNAIQIVASDMVGNEVDLILTITYQP